MRAGARVFVDTGAWIALALRLDPLHSRARSAWQELRDGGAKLYTSIPVVIETFTFLERNATRDVALRWKESIDELKLGLLECKRKDLGESWEYFNNRGYHKLSAVDATSFVIMRRHELRAAFAFDHHFAQAGFRMVG